MPNVNGKKFPYTKKGIAAAKKAADEKKKPMKKKKTLMSGNYK
jgi:hypothetical protein|tara:strand:- start:1536 stop:1664 length:129 start_codon:yes stop_codon:yes gene_type:complete